MGGAGGDVVMPETGHPRPVEPAGVGTGLARSVLAEGIGTAMLLAAVVGSGIMAERLAGGNVAIVLLANTLATGAALAALILTFGPVSGGHFNPAVTLAEASQGSVSWRATPGWRWRTSCSSCRSWPPRSAAAPASDSSSASSWPRSGCWP
jgi:hypothetical protein